MFEQHLVNPGQLFQAAASNSIAKAVMHTKTRTEKFM